MSQFRVETTSRVEAKEWNAWVSKASWGTIFQTSFWADRLCELWDCQPYFFTVYSKSVNVPVLALLGFDIRSDVVRDKHVQLIRRLENSARKIQGKYRRFQWFGQPALLNPETGAGAYKVLFSRLEDFCRTNKIPTIGPSEIPTLAAALLPSEWQRTEWATFIVDLQQSEQALWRNLKKTARKAIRSARENGLLVRQILSLEDLRAYYDFAARCALRYGKNMHGFVDYETMWRYLRPNAIFETFVAEKEGTLIAGLSVWGFNGIIAELGSFQSERGFTEKLYGSDLIKWEVLRWGSQQGCRAFDLAGVSPKPQTAKEQGIRQFKEKWGGLFQSYYTVSSRVSEI